MHNVGYTVARDNPLWHLSPIIR